MMNKKAANEHTKAQKTILFYRKKQRERIQCLKMEIPQSHRPITIAGPE